MLYHKLFSQYSERKVYAGVIGAGHFGTAVVTQQMSVKNLHVPIVADMNLESAKSAFLKSGVAEEQIRYVDNVYDAEKLISEGFFVYTDYPLIMTELDIIDVVCEGTGVPEASANFCLAALNNGKHVAAISKEMDSVIGPILTKKAKDKGLVYSPVDGDQPALLISLVEWARTIGLTVISAGKARDGEFVLDEKNNTVMIKADGITVHEDALVHVNPEDMKYLQMIPKGKSEEYVEKRRELLQSLPNAGAFDLCELTMIANATGLKPSVAETTQATLRITELPVAYCHKRNDGIYEEEGIIDVHTNFRRDDESGMGGGVYMVVRCDNAYSNYILTTKGQIPNHDLTTAVIYRPYHLCGVETSTTILTAALLGLDTGGLNYLPMFDLVKRAERDIAKGEALGNDHDLKLKALIMNSTKRAPDSYVPGHMVTGNIAVRDIKKGEIITYDMIEDKSDTTLWKLRKEQEETF